MRPTDGTIAMLSIDQVVTEYYPALNERMVFLDFNVDPFFNNCGTDW